MSMPNYSQETLDQIVDMYKSGHGATTIQRAFKCSDSTVYRALKLAGVTVRGPRTPRPSTRKQWEDTDIADIRGLWGEGWSKRRIAQWYGVSEGTIHRLLLSIGIDPHDTRYVCGPDNHRWTGGRNLTTGGYINLYITEDMKPYVIDPTARYVREHRYVMGKHLGRPLYRYESVHHIDGDRANNELDNLQLRTQHHGEGQVWQCCDCGSFNTKAKPIA